MFSAISSTARRLGDLFFGYDFFISYAHDDGERYPTALADRLQESGFRVFLDSRVYVAGDDIRHATRRRIRMSKYLLAVVGPCALTSRWVLIEVQRCLEVGGVPIAINLGRTLENADRSNPLKLLLEDKIFVADASNTGDDEPDRDTVAKVIDSFKATRQDLIRTRAVAGAVVVLLLAIVVAGWQHVVAERRAERAQEQQALRFVADADRQLFSNPQQAVILAAQGVAASPSETSRKTAQGAVQRALAVIEQRQDLQKETNWGSNFFQSYIAGAWFEADLGARYNRAGNLLLLTTERGSSGANPPGDAVLLDTQTLETIPLDIGVPWGTRELGPGPIASFRVNSDVSPLKIPFVFTSGYKKVSEGILVVGDGSSEVTIVVGGADDSRWQASGAKAQNGKVAVAPGAKISFEVAGAKHGLTFLDKGQMTNRMEREGNKVEFRYKVGIKPRSKGKRRLEFVGFSATRQKIYLARQYNIEIYGLDGTFEKEISTGGGCTKYPISLVTGVLQDRLILYGDTDGALYRLDPSSERCSRLARKTGRIPIRFDANADETLGVVIFKDGTAAIVQINEQLSRKSLNYLPNETIQTASFHPVLADRLLTAGDDGHVAVWQVTPDTQREIRRFRSSGTGIGFARYSDDSTRIVGVDQDKKLYIWNSESGALLEKP